MRWVVGLLLICAALLKATQLLTVPAVSLANPLGRFFVPLQIGAEAGLGVFALQGVYWRQLRWLALVLFTGFAVYSLYLATSGAASCGCFGPIEIHPWWTFVLDVAVVTSLLISIRSSFDGSLLPVASGRRAALATTLAALSLSVAVAHGWYAMPSQADSPAAVGELMMLQPETWIGKPLPIAEYIDADLSSGDWTILLHRHDCPEFQEAVPRYEDLAYQRNIAIVEMPPYNSELVADGPALHARLPDDREWFVQTPVEIQLDDGIVVNASTELPVITLDGKM